MKVTVTSRPLRPMEALLQGPKDLEHSYTWDEEVRAAFETQNSLASLLQDETRTVEDESVDPYYDVTATMTKQEMDEFESHLPYLSRHAMNDEHRNALMERYRRELHNREVLAEGGVSAFMWQMAAGIVDPLLLPTYLIPGGALSGVTRVATAGRTALAAAGAAAVSELALHGTQSARTWDESMYAIGGSTVFGAALGGVVGPRRMLDKAVKAANDEVDKIYRNSGVEPEVRPLGRKSINAAETDPRSLEGEGAGIISKQPRFARFTPLIRGLASPSVTVRSLVNDLLRHPFANGKTKMARVDAEGKPMLDAKGNPLYDHQEMAIPLEAIIDRERKALVSTYMTRATKLWKEMQGHSAYRVGRHGGMSFNTFWKEVGKAMRRGDDHPIPQVKAMAEHMRKEIFDPIKERYQRFGLLEDDLDVKFAESFFPRVYNTRYIRKNLNRWDAVLRAHFEKVELDREIYESADRILETMRSEGKKVNRTTKERVRLQLRREMGNTITDEMRETAKVRAKQVTENILHSPDGRMKLDEPNVPDFLGERRLQIEDADLEEFLVDNAEYVTHSFIMRSVGETEWLERFGTLDLEELNQRIADDYLRLHEAAPDDVKYRAKLDRMENTDKQDLQAVQALMLNRFSKYGDEVGWWTDFARLARNLTYMARLGGMVISAFPDLARPLMTQGVRATAKAMAPSLLAFTKKVRMNAEGWRELGIAAESVLNSRAFAIGMIDEGSHVMTKMARGFTTITGMNFWNSQVKMLAARAAQNRMIDDIVNYSRLSPSRKQRLAQSGIGEKRAAALREQLEKYGEDIYGSRDAGLHSWDNEDLKTFWADTVFREVENTIITPGIGDRPVFMNSQLGATLLQFKSFFLAAHNHQTLLAVQKIQNGDLMPVLWGLSGAAALGWFAELGKLATAGRLGELDYYDPPDVVRAIADRSGLIPVPMELYNIADSFTGGKLSSDVFGADMRGLRYFDRNFTGALLGPAAGYLDDAGRALQGAALEDFTGADLHRIRRLLPAQNLFYLRQMFDAMEESTTDTLGLEPRESKRRPIAERPNY